MPIDFKIEIETMRQNFIRGNKKIGRLPTKPAWMTANETLSKIYDELPELAETGKIHYACIVQANAILFKAFPQFNCPANIIFGTDEYYDDNIYELTAIAKTLYNYKGVDGAPDNIKKITDSITDEHERLYNIKLPDIKDIKPGVFIQTIMNRLYNIKLPDSIDIKPDVFFTTIMIYRKYLPGRKLSGSIFPVITNPKNLQSAMILPQKYWSSVFVDFFKNKI